MILRYIPFPVICRFPFIEVLSNINICRSLPDPKELYEELIISCLISFSARFTTKNGAEEEHQLFYPVIIRRVHSNKRFFPKSQIIFEPNYDQLISHLCRHQGEPMEMTLQTTDGCVAIGGKLVGRHSVARVGRGDQYRVVNGFKIVDGLKKKPFPAKVFFKRCGDVTKLHAISIPFSYVMAALVANSSARKK